MISSESRRGARGTGSLLTLGIKKIAEERKAGRPGQAKKKKKPEKSLKRLKVKTGEIKKTTTTTDSRIILVLQLFESLVSCVA